MRALIFLRLHPSGRGDGFMKPSQKRTEYSGNVLALKCRNEDFVYLAASFRIHYKDSILFYDLEI